MSMDVLFLGKWRLRASKVGASTVSESPILSGLNEAKISVFHLTERYQSHGPFAWQQAHKMAIFVTCIQSPTVSIEGDVVGLVGDGDL